MDHRGLERQPQRDRDLADRDQLVSLLRGRGWIRSPDAGRLAGLHACRAAVVMGRFPSYFLLALPWCRLHPHLDPPEAA
jgi:hypothetical protein